MTDDDKQFFDYLHIIPSHNVLEYSRDIPGAIIYDGFILSFLPVHPDFIKPMRGNIHACAYKGQVMREDTITVVDGHIITSLRYDKRYLSVAENEHMTSWEDCVKLFEERANV